MKVCGGCTLLQNSLKLNSIILRNYSSVGKNLNQQVSFLLENYNLSDTQAREELKASAIRRGCTVDVDHLADLSSQFKSKAFELDEGFLHKIYKEFSKLPNNTCPKSLELTEPHSIGVFGKKRILENALTLEQLSHHGVDMTTGNFTGSRSYYLRGSMAQLEFKLIRYALKHLQQEGFRLMSVPDLLFESILASCGVPVDGERTMVYSIDPHHFGAGSEKVSLAGTAEMAFGGWLRGRSFTEAQLPLKLCAVSRCYRAETSRLKEEQGIFRVHHFTKVEMFGVTANESGHESDELYSQLLQTQIDILKGLGLHGQVVLMPPEELGNPAYSKTDLEVWLPGRGRYAELTSASNCTSYQAARLGTTYLNSKGHRKLVHTVNGTAVAVPRCIIALCETHQEATGRRALMLPKILGLPSVWQQPKPPPSVQQQPKPPPSVQQQPRPPPPTVTQQSSPPLSAAPASNQVDKTEFGVGRDGDQTSDAAVDPEDFLDKVMVYNEQCLRKSLSFKKYKDFIESE